MYYYGQFVRAILSLNKTRTPGIIVVLLPQNGELCVAAGLFFIGEKDVLFGM
ncbi:hypothetical protein HMPREF1250_0387 [Megasphaera vaginalis (ex Srinivasan et al. 2021)]|uniref:Uncharacterized protein n=1 Tax=Megasphaera vaginalis (ex Srinivasan et al. 2021) TaxID=1111454 RepID=U7UTA0_9FIRM|nr:hypothetical protein HMPREF1250_0387 [Megasphaera vaginalis (ex Srinivasan et al. 2021)]